MEVPRKRLRSVSDTESDYGSTPEPELDPHFEENVKLRAKIAYQKQQLKSVQAYIDLIQALLIAE